MKSIFEHVRSDSEDLHQISSGDLVANTRALAEKERKLGVQILRHLREIERRRLFAERGYSSLHEFCVKELKYSDGAAHRRISAMRLIRDMPEVEAAIAEARVTMTNAAMLQGFLRSERMERRKTYTADEKRGLLAALEGKSSRECERSLAAISPSTMPRERERVISETETEIRFVANARVQKMLHRLREVTVHSVKTGGYAGLIEKSLEIALKVVDPMEKVGARPNAESSQCGGGRKSGHKAPGQGDSEASAPKDLGEERASAQKLSGEQGTFAAVLVSKERRYIPRTIFREVWRRDQGKRTFLDPLTKRRCDSRFGLEIDHVEPLALGGVSQLDNLRLLCKSHNQLLAMKHFGESKIQSRILRQAIGVAGHTLSGGL